MNTTTQFNHHDFTVHVAPIAAHKKQINDPNSQDTTMLDVHNNYIDAEQVAYEEVASIISNKDDPNMLYLTFRVWFIGLFFTALHTSFNQMFWYRAKHKFSINSIFTILLSFLLGKLFALLLPTKCWSFANRYQFSFNPGPFTFKEHILIVIMFGASTDVINLFTPIDGQRVFGNETFNFITAIIFCASLSLTVFGIAGIMRRFLVWPSTLLWPENLTKLALIRTLNDQLVDGFSVSTSSSTYEISRLKFFIIATICQCVYIWLPNYFMRILLAFGWLCWFNSNSLVWSQLTGIKGFGIGSLTFDWIRMKEMWNSPIIVPLWAKINILIGFVLFVWILGPLCFYTNFLELNYSPIRSGQILRSKGYVDDSRAYIDWSTFTINETKYKLYGEQHGEIRLSVAFVLRHGFTFLLFTSLIVHTILYHGSDLLKQARTSVSNRNNDIHCFLMSKYPETPEWWFTIVFILSLITGMLICQFGQLMEWYHVLLTVVINWTYILPSGIVRANTGILVDDMISGYIGSFVFHGKPLSLLTFRTYGFYLRFETLKLVADLKLCHYAKIPPRSVFIALVGARLVAVVAGYMATDALSLNIKAMCDNNVDWSCSKIVNDMVSAIQWSSIGIRVGFDDTYKHLLWMLLIGAILPLPFWLLHKRYPKTIWLKYVHIPIMVAPAAYWNTTPSSETFTWLIFGLLCHLLIHRWWYDRYSLLFSAAMDTGAVIISIISWFIFYNGTPQVLDWWGSRIKDKCTLADHAGFPYKIDENN